MEKIKTGLVGFGSVGEGMHAPLIHWNESLKLFAVVERHHEKSKKAYPQVTVFKTLEAMLASEVELVVIVTPNHLHFDQAKAALEADKHVVVDKPMCVTSVEAKVLKELAERKGLILSVFQNRRWDGDFLTVKKLMSSDRLGRVVHFESHFDRFRPNPKNHWKEKEHPGSGMLYDLGPHLIDQALGLFGRPDWVYAEILKQRPDAAMDDFFEISMMFGQLKVRLTASIYVNAPIPRFLILGEKGSYSKFGLDIQEAALKEGKIPNSPDWGVEEESAYGIFHGEVLEERIPTIPGDYRKFYQNIAEAIQGKSGLEVLPSQIVEGLLIIEACLKSHDLGRRIYAHEIF
ncbi:Gfo/Idh/MocA family oxidoreductase [Litoribacter alkaliphilus]|uniref:Gfo/Idh/MocA family oxidoreductase n=1 Tax=Litoribacter ruber TaxID=702568 RepID=A0AAP2CH86_9BACT|nr:Gfo/Idh/MocA family oxidoreductase [Litoribacter alkaliphilus]MBS9523659.1 Gfo/Idh/MocA family oxidoreductase [Litoribacter alkaliphilus]